MLRIGAILFSVFLFACGNGKTEEEEETEFSYKAFSEKFKETSAPYFIADTTLLKASDTTSLKNAVFLSYIPDSTKKNIFGKSTNIKYTPIAKISSKGKESYFIVKAYTPQKATALLMVFDKDEKFGAIFPFLNPDKDENTTQVSSIDKSFSISRSVIRRQTNDVSIEGKDVYVYNNEAKQFTLIMTDLLDEKNLEVINPIDTFAKTNKLAGDFSLDKRNIVSIRDGRNDKSLTVFVHIEKENGDCIGEIKGDAVLTSTTTAVYRQGGDPCVLEFTFASNSVTLKEVEGCGSRRDLNCLFDGTFKRRKEVKKDTANQTNSQSAKK
jgi:hypothetical protein